MLFAITLFKESLTCCFGSSSVINVNKINAFSVAENSQRAAAVSFYIYVGHFFKRNALVGYLLFLCRGQWQENGEVAVLHHVLLSSRS